MDRARHLSLPELPIDSLLPLLVRGDDSNVLPSEAAQRMLAENAGVSFARIPDCGHSITLDSPHRLLELVSP